MSEQVKKAKRLEKTLLGAINSMDKKPLSLEDAMERLDYLSPILRFKIFNLIYYKKEPDFNRWITKVNAYLYKAMNMVIKSPRGKLTTKEYYDALWNHPDEPEFEMESYNVYTNDFPGIISNNFTDVEIWNRMQRVFIYISKELYNKTFINIKPIIDQVLSEKVDTYNYMKYKLSTYLAPIYYKIDNNSLITNLSQKQLKVIYFPNETAIPLREAKAKLYNILDQLRFQIFKLIYFKDNHNFNDWSNEANNFLLDARDISIESPRGKFTAREYYDQLFDDFSGAPKAVIERYKNDVKNYTGVTVNDFTDIEIWNIINKVYIYLSKELYTKKFQDIKPIIAQVLSEAANKTIFDDYKLNKKLVPINYNTDGK